MYASSVKRHSARPNRWQRNTHHLIKFCQEGVWVWGQRRVWGQWRGGGPRSGDSKSGRSGVRGLGGWGVQGQGTPGQRRSGVRGWGVGPVLRLWPCHAHARNGFLCDLSVKTEWQMHGVTIGHFFWSDPSPKLRSLAQFGSRPHGKTGSEIQKNCWTSLRHETVVKWTPLTVANHAACFMELDPFPVGRGRFLLEEFCRSSKVRRKSEIFLVSSSQG